MLLISLHIHIYYNNIKWMGNWRQILHVYSGHIGLVVQICSIEFTAFIYIPALVVLAHIATIRPWDCSLSSWLDPETCQVGFISMGILLRCQRSILWIYHPSCIRMHIYCAIINQLSINIGLNIEMVHIRRCVYLWVNRQQAVDYNSTVSEMHKYTRDEEVLGEGDNLQRVALTFRLVKEHCL